MVNRRAEIEPGVCLHTHLSAHPVRHRHADFIDINHQRIAVPAQLTRADGELFVIPVAEPRAALGHGPSFGVAAVQRHIQCAVIVRLSVAARPVPGVIRRKHTAYKSNDAQAPMTVIA